MENVNTELPIGTRVARIRHWRGLTQTQLAARIGLSRPSLSKIEQSQEIEAEKLVQIAEALDVSVEDIKNFEDLSPLQFTQNNYDGSSHNYSGLYHCTFNPIDKLMELADENKQLYEKLLQSEREKFMLLNEFLKKQKE